MTTAMQGFPDWSFVLTDRGNVRITQIRRGDKVTTNGNDFHEVLAVRTAEYEGEMIRVTAVDTALQCTPDQLLRLDVSAESFKASTWRSAAQLKLGDTLQTCSVEHGATLAVSAFLPSERRVMMLGIVEDCRETIYALEVEGGRYVVDDIIVEGAR